MDSARPATVKSTSSTFRYKDRALTIFMPAGGSCSFG
jgi:hypothetical protein